MVSGGVQHFKIWYFKEDGEVVKHEVNCEIDIV
jgi:hypothetical protein